MAVDTKQGTTNPPAGTPGPAATLAGIPAMTANGRPRKRPSSLMAQASALPSVENSLDEFIAKANETLIDPSTFNTAAVKHEEDEKRKEHDALRWKATEQQMREAQHREESLRRQLDGLQGKLAEAEARAAVAGSGGSQDGIVADLKLRLTMADEKIRSSEERARVNEGKVGKLEQDLAAAQSAAAHASAAPAARDSLVGIGDDDAEQRVRFAEAKATKAIAAAKAAAAGLTVSAADIAAIESGLAISTLEPAKKTSWGLVAAAFIVGGAIMFAVAFVTLKKDAKPATSAAGAQPAAAVEKQPEAAPAPAKVTATPIDDKAAAPADDKAAAPAADDKAPAPADDKAAAAPAADDKAEKAAAAKAAAEDAAAAKAEKAAAAKAAAEDAAAARAEKAAAAKAAAAPKKAAPKKTAVKKASSSGAIADPFGDTPAPAKKKKKDSGIVDPF